MFNPDRIIQHHCQWSTAVTDSRRRRDVKVTPADGVGQAPTCQQQMWRSSKQHVLLLDNAVKVRLTRGREGSRRLSFQYLSRLPSVSILALKRLGYICEFVSLVNVTCHIERSFLVLRWFSGFKNNNDYCGTEPREPLRLTTATCCSSWVADFTEQQLYSLW